jgi:hypothetical protein
MATLTVGFREIKYGQGACNGAVCKLITIDITTSGPHNVAAGEAISLDLVATTYGERDRYEQSPRRAGDGVDH